MNSLEKRKYQSLIFQAFFARRHRVHFSPQSHATAFALHCTTFFLLGALAGKMVRQAISDCEWQKGMKNDKKSSKSVIRTHPPSRMLWFFVASVWSDVAQFRITISWHRLSPHSAPPFLAMGYWRGGTMARKRSATSAQLWRLYTVQFFKQRPWRRIR